METIGTLYLVLLPLVMGAALIEGLWLSRTRREGYDWAPKILKHQGEAYLDKVLEPKFLVEVGAETLNLFLPGATLVKVLAIKGMEMAIKK